MNNSRSGSCLSLDDFDFAEKDNPEPEIEHGGSELRCETDTGPDFLAAFFQASNSGKNRPAPETAAPKKFAKKSQKERKREEMKPKQFERELAAGSPKERWSGWGSKSPTESSPSFADIVTDEKAAKGRGEHNGSGAKPKAGAGGVGRNRKSSWRQLSFDEESTPTTNVKPPQPPSNPWKQLPPMSAAKDISARGADVTGGYVETTNVIDCDSLNEFEMSGFSLC